VVTELLCNFFGKEEKESLFAAVLYRGNNKVSFYKEFSEMPLICRAGLLKAILITCDMLSLTTGTLSLPVKHVI
jgi:hypothetical protein